MNKNRPIFAMEVMGDLFEPAKHLLPQPLHWSFFPVCAEDKPFLVVIESEVRVVFDYSAGYACQSLILFIHIVCLFQ